MDDGSIGIERSQYGARHEERGVAVRLPFRRREPIYSIASNVDERVATDLDDMEPEAPPEPGRPLSKRQRLAQTKPYRWFLQRITPDLLTVEANAPIAAPQFGRADLRAEVIAYFASERARGYQIEQWLPVFGQLHARHRLLVVTRNLSTFRYLQDCTDLPLVFVRTLFGLQEVLERCDPKACLYVNNDKANFQALRWPRALHVHLNHGESDKVSMASNQAKAYDLVLVAGEAAERRYLQNLLGFDATSLARIGRPQLDLEAPRLLPVSTRPTVLYAPTWDGDTAAMNYTSVANNGPALVRSLVADGGFRVVYKPHPRVATGRGGTVAGHLEIVRTLEAANAGVPASERHVVELEAPIVSLYPSCDVMLSDVSSVALDWLYLRTEAPLWICDPRNDRRALEEASPLAARTYVLDREAMPQAAARIRESYESDPRRAEREEARRFYFGELSQGESTRRFLDTIDEVVARREALLRTADGEVAPVSITNVADPNGVSTLGA